MKPVLIERLVDEHGTPLLLLDCGVARVQFQQLRSALPGVDLHYALKPCPHPALASTLLAEGAGFDVASSREIELMREVGVPASRCIHTHPVKSTADIEEALRFGIDTFVADNEQEVLKFVPYRHRASLMIRVAIRNPEALWDLSAKFGCEAAHALALMVRARQLGVWIRGLSFHVGSQASSPDKHVEGINVCSQLIALARSHGFQLDLLDIGGGFPAPYSSKVMTAESYCLPIREALAALPQGIRLIAEPGRFIAAPAMSAVARVMGKAMRQGRWWYYLDDGVYGSFSAKVYDHSQHPIDPLYATGPRTSSVLAGPTCDSIDVVRDDIALPELEIGDLVVAKMMGAYTWTSASDFNFLPRARIVVLERPGSEAKSAAHIVAEGV